MANLIERLNGIRKLAIISLFYDDDFLSLFVLKGGNALNLVYGANNRASMDIDVSMEDDFNPEELKEVEMKLRAAFEEVFGEAGYHVFDFTFGPSPVKVRPEYKGFWGGYYIELKIIEKEKFGSFNGNLDQLRRLAAVVGMGQERKLSIDISKYEYVAPKRLETLDDYSIYVYSPVMIVYEKLRAICQQMEEYRSIVRTNRRPRARDFFDIYTIVEGWRSPVDVFDPVSMEIGKEIFSIKKVPTDFLSLIREYREFHRDDFNSVVPTVNAGRIESYDFYFDYVVNMAERLHELLIQQQILQTAETAVGAEDESE